MATDQDALKKVKQQFKDNHDIGHMWIDAYESAKQPVRVDVERCAKALYGDRSDHCFIEETKAFLAWENQRKEFKDSYILLAKSVLSVVKDAAKEMGVEVRYE